MTSLRADFRQNFHCDLVRYILLHFLLLFASTPAACFRFADGVPSTQCRIADEQVRSPIGSLRLITEPDSILLFSTFVYVTRLHFLVSLC